jgi:hypothetical protein
LDGRLVIRQRTALCLALSGLVAPAALAGYGRASADQPAPLPSLPATAFRPVGSPHVVASPVPIEVRAEVLAPSPSPLPRPIPRLPATGPVVVVVPTPAPKPRLGSKPAGTPSVAYAKAYALSRIGSTQFSCLDRLFTRESNWNPYSRNSSSGAYGIPQALPGDKMAVAGADWRTNPVTQVRWGLSYIASRYGTACNAWAHSQNYGWY